MKLIPRSNMLKGAIVVAVAGSVGVPASAETLMDAFVTAYQNNPVLESQRFLSLSGVTICL